MIKMCKECGVQPKRQGQGQRFCSDKCATLAKLKHKRPTKESVRLRAAARRVQRGGKPRGYKVWVDGSRRCPTCHQYFTPENMVFHGPNNKAANCVGCFKDNKRRGTLKKYGLTLEEYVKMRDEQNNLCAICSQEETERHQSGTIVNLCVDQDHCTGKVRALLCRDCNRKLGRLLEDADWLTPAIKYLLDHDTQIKDLIKER